MPEVTVLTLLDGVRVVVPDSLDLITPYVLREQLDFFEDELPFVRTLLEPGQAVIDIGANYGVYTLPMAQKVGPAGHVWAFEPARETSGFLARSVVENGFENVTLESKAVSRVAGRAHLGAHVHSELRAIVHGPAVSPRDEAVPLVTLDDSMDRHGWSGIDFIKMDAEGEEDNILSGGSRLFAMHDPLVQYELRKDVTGMNMGLVGAFAARGYDSYRLIPGLRAVAPFERAASPDPYLLNLFACKPSRAERIAARGLLLPSADLREAAVKSVGITADAKGGKYQWPQAIGHMAYVSELEGRWAGAEERGASAEVQLALRCYARSRDTEIGLADRYLALEASFSRLAAICEREPTGMRLASLSRVADDYGARAIAVRALKQLLESIRRTGIPELGEPFLAPLKRFEAIPLGESPIRWVLASVLEQLERREWFSTFYAGPSARERLEDIDVLGFSCPDMRRRLDLVRLRIERAQAAKARPPLSSF